MKNNNRILLLVVTLLIAVVAIWYFKKDDTAYADITESEIHFDKERETELRESAQMFFGSLSDLPREEISSEKIELGKRLFFDKRLSKNETISCNSCHSLTNYGVDNLPLSPGDTKEVGNRNSPTVFYSSLHSMQFWDGRAEDVEEQAGGPILNPVEHAIPSEEFLEERLRGIEVYQALFKEVYPDSVQPITFNNITDAIGAFERQLNPKSRYDDWVDGDNDAMTAAEKVGLQAFIDNACITCHTGPAFGGIMLQKFGLHGNYWEHTKSEVIDKGLYDLNKDEALKYVFKTPGLRNIEKTHPYFHDGSVEDLDEAIRIMGELQIGKTISDEDVQSIETFLKALTADIDEEHKSTDWPEDI
ncbi:MAG TPA: cytochrome-c peroxidase [Flavobacteriaceae bacterium]|nr:cytochrome-c peroxidase [Flavobacteriaceae bacterium]